MSISITAIFERCCQETGVSFEIHGRGKRPVCPFHGGRGTFTLNESQSSWHCFSGGCPSPSGGYLAAPIAFGIVSTPSESSRWLSERGLIPPPHSKGSNAAIVWSRSRIVLETLNEEQRDVWREAQLDLVEEIGYDYWIRVRDVTGKLRFEMERRREKVRRSFERMNLEEQAWLDDGAQGGGPGTCERMRLIRERPDLYLDSRWDGLKRYLPTRLSNQQHQATLAA